MKTGKMLEILEILVVMTIGLPIVMAQQTKTPAYAIRCVIVGYPLLPVTIGFVLYCKLTLTGRIPTPNTGVVAAISKGIMWMHLGSGD